MTYPKRKGNYTYFKSSDNLFFGKYYGERISKLLKSDPQYIKYLVENSYNYVFHNSILKEIRRQGFKLKPINKSKTKFF